MPDAAMDEPDFSPARYAEALRTLQSRISGQLRRVLKAHAEAPQRLMSVFDIAAVAGNKGNDNYTYSAYGRLGRLLAGELDPDATARFGFQPIWTRYIGNDFRINQGEPVHWVMHRELAEALRILGWAEPDMTVDIPPDNPFADIDEAKDELEVESETVREALILSRIGQGRFRAELLDYWDGCAVTGIGRKEALRASHIKPWIDSSNTERLDPFNGLLLVGTVDLLFDAGLISFADDGAVLISAELEADERIQLGVRDDLKLRKIDSRHLPFLQFHRKNVFLAD